MAETEKTAKPKPDLHECAEEGCQILLAGKLERCSEHDPMIQGRTAGGQTYQTRTPKPDRAR